MKRRAFLAAAGGSIAFSAGCLSSASSTEMDPQDPDWSESEVGLAPDPIEVPERDVDESRFKDYQTEGTTIKLIPLDVAYYWYNTRKARFVDTRVREQYDAVHIKGAAHSPAPEGGNDDPLDGVSKQDRIVAYCTCPHHLSGIRTANLLDNGYSGPYALDPGFDPWVNEGYPIGGTDSNNPNMENYPDDYSRVGGTD
ncbi:rhodanese-like domain-containing protein [Halosimplex pelagicum]|jgi:rhodanese-related sulfurtransferase|uniref:Rhodanese-like domain-containing protein n=1 Tax=Halosimplex pelagicum TaxID=869886 RepID=A0A7D5TBA9_9EURY|nr:rhodanese-like domain-containing protein [Halosimplex pelagicum]QLH82113.1 rhodanese-like domain-containing protein [Halosimplex pelagicum]